MVNKARLIYVSHFLSAWGDRMWRFAVALFLMDLASDTLLLPAIYGLTLAGSVLTLGPVVGNLIDRSRRLPAAQATVIIQNLAIAICAGILLLHKLSLVKADWFLLFVKISSVFLGTIAHLASTASTIVLEKDWIVVIADGDHEMLSNLNSVLRRIDLTTKLLAPMVVGQLITLVSMTFGCAFVAGWNVVSMFLEYIMLQIVYKNTPGLAQKKGISTRRHLPIDNTVDATHSEGKPPEDCIGSDDDEPLIVGVPHQDKIGAETTGLYPDEISNQTEISGSASNDIITDSDDEPLILADGSNAHDNNHANASATIVQDPMPCWKSIFQFILVIPKGWGLFMSQSVALAGMGLACLYMTVLGFDSITVSYAYNQCFSEFFVGLIMGASAITGILSTFAFGPLCRRFGLVRTGQFSSIAHVLSLAPCVYSVFAPGSPFFLLPQNRNSSASHMTTTPGSFGDMPYTAPPDYWELGNLTTAGEPSSSGIFLKCIDGIAPPSSYLSLSLLMAGAVLARVGLWAFDLTVTQLFQEEVAENERGIVNGVQSSINNLMDLIHFVLVIFLPDPSQFGFLVLISAAFVCFGHFLYAIFARKVGGHFCVCR